MRKNLIRIIIILLSSLLLTCTGYLYIVRSKKIKPIKNMPEIKLMSLDSSIYKLNEIGNNKLPTILIAFHPDCNYCILECKELLSKAEALQKINIVFISFATPDEIFDFLKLYPINQLPNTQVYIDNNYEFFSIYNITSPPHCIIYNTNHQLVTQYKGLFTLEQIQKHL